MTAAFVSLASKHCGTVLFFKILPPGNLKPQDKHLQTRVEYLIKLLKQAALEDKAEQLRKVIYLSLGYGLLHYTASTLFSLEKHIMPAAMSRGVRNDGVTALHESHLL